VAEQARVLRIEVPVDTDEDVAALRAALLAARASELAEVRRRNDRLSWGYGSDSAREGMTDEIDARERRWRMVDRVLEALETLEREVPGRGGEPDPA
jgi:hypothetical protein